MVTTKAICFFIKARLLLRLAQLMPSSHVCICMSCIGGVIAWTLQFFISFISACIKKVCTSEQVFKQK